MHQNEHRKVARFSNNDLCVLGTPHLPQSVARVDCEQLLHRCLEVCSHMKVPFCAPIRVPWTRANENWPLCSQRTKSFPQRHIYLLCSLQDPGEGYIHAKKQRQKEDVAWKQPCAQNRVSLIPIIIILQRALIRAIYLWRLPLYAQSCYKKTVLPLKSLKLKDNSKQVQRSQRRPQTSSQIMAVIR